VKDFKEFLLRGNLVDMAVGIVIGLAFAAVITALVADLVTPLIAAIGGNPDFSSLSFTINNSHFLYGAFINALITFLLTATVVYFAVVLPMKTIAERRKRGEEAGPVAPTQVELLVEIRDLLRAQQGRGPGTDPSGPGTTVLPGQL
jgi:large conductance mechanosensitive channel